MHYDDNFGVWDMNDDREGQRSFYRYVQRNSVTKTCADCGRKVRLMPHYAICSPCADARERFGGY